MYNRLSIPAVFALMTVLGLHAFAGSPNAAFLQTSSTTSQSAVFAPFLSSVNGGELGDAAISVSNLLGTPLSGNSPAGDAFFNPSYSRDFGDTVGPLTFYLFSQTGETAVFSSADYPMIGVGLDAAGQLAPGGTFTVLLSDLLSVIFPGSAASFSGYAWIVADFDAVGGTVTNFFTGLNTGNSYVMDPPMGGVPVAVTQSVVYEFDLEGSQVVPPVNTGASGLCTVLLSEDQSSLDVNCQHSVANPTAAHIHRAPEGQNGPILIPLGNGSSPIVGTFEVTPDLVEDLLAGDLYVQVHSQAFQAGELRGQIVNP